MPFSPKVLLIAVAVAMTGLASNAQQPAPSSSPSPTVAATPAPAASATPEASPTPIPLADLTMQIVFAEGERGKIEEESLAKPLATLTSEVVTQGRMIDSIQAESAKSLVAGLSLEAIRDLETRCQGLDEMQADTDQRLNERSKRYDETLVKLDNLGLKWAELQKQAKADKDTPPGLLKRLEALNKAIPKMREEIQKRREKIALLLPQGKAQAKQIDDTWALIKQAHTRAMGRLFYIESLPIWSETVSFRSARNLPQESWALWSKQWSELAQYAHLQSPRFLGHGFLLAALLAGLYWARKRVRIWADDEPSLKRAALVFENPIAMALAFSLLLGGWIYPNAPDLLLAIIGAAALIPAVLILRRLVDPHLFPILNAMVVFYATDQVRTIASPFPFLARWLFVAELAGGVLFLIWLLRTSRLETMRKEDERFSKATLAGARLALGVFLAALLANVIGCVILGNLLGNAALRSAYLAVILYAATRIADGLIIGGLASDWLAGLGMVRRYRTLIWHRTHRLFQVAAALWWVAGTLEMLTLRSPLVEHLWGFFHAFNEKGELTKDLSLAGQLLSFGLVVWAAFLLSRFVRFALEEDFYPRMQVERGLSYSVSTMLHYAVLLIGFYVAASAAGVDMTKFTILAGAFGVGMGFGLQNIINNFVSGVILLFERPIKVGDVVQMDTAAGVVDRIGIRASIIRTGSGSEIIVPNGKLISDQVVNWTLSNRQRGIDLPVAVAYGVDPERVIELLKRLAAAHPLVATRPTPSAQLVGFGADALQFELHAWTDCYEQWGQIRSDLAVAVHAEFIKEKIAMPYAQRDLHLRSISPEALLSYREALAKE